jgi:hypothetical protein
MLRETTFVLGGALTVGLGLLLGVGLFLSGAGLEFYTAWLAAGIAVGLGAFFVSVGRSEGRERRRALRALEEGDAGPTRPK